MENEQGYKEIIEKIMESKVGLFGYFAVYVAKATPGLELDKEGRVISLSENPKEVIHHLLLRFEDKAGKASALAVKTLIAELKSKYPGLGLPEELM